MIQIGDANDADKPRFAKLKPSQSIETITLEEAMELFKLPLALGALRAREHAGVDKLHQAPGPRERQQRLDAGRLHLLVVQAVGLGQQLHRIQIHTLG